MKCLILFSGKIKKTISVCRLLKILPSVLSVKDMGNDTYFNYRGSSNECP